MLCPSACSISTAISQTQCCVCKTAPGQHSKNEEHQAALSLSWCRLEDDLRRQRDDLAGLQQQLEAKAEECIDVQARARSTSQQLQQAQGELLHKVRHPALCKWH